MDYQDLGERIRKRRKEFGWTQDMLAAKIGVSTSFVGHIERGSRKASLETLVQLANTMNVSTDYLLENSLTIEYKSQDEMPALRPGQRIVMKEILLALHDHLDAWNSGSENNPE